MRFDAFHAEFNEERPHEALAQMTPASIYVPSLRPMPSCSPPPEYAAHLEVCRLSRAGTFRFHNRQIFLSDALYFSVMP